MRIARAVLGFLATIGVAAGCATGVTALGTTSGAGASTGSGSTSGAGGGGGCGVTPAYEPCSQGMPCGPGKSCVNGLCAAGCNTQADCPSGDYCDLTNGQVCLASTLTACPCTPCAPTQVCVEGLCATQPTANGCAPNPFGGDGCMNDELCLGNIIVDGMMMPNSVCYVLPPCSTAHPCTPGGMGALCSTGFLKGKDDMCIPGACATDANCPASWKCLPPVGMQGYGTCSNGAKGSYCAKTADCGAGLMCYTPIMDQLGTCK